MLEKIHFFADERNAVAVRAKQVLGQYYGDHVIDEADVIVALGGDGLMLNAMNLGLKHHKKIYGLNLGKVGALLNRFNVFELKDRIAKSIATPVQPLSVKANQIPHPLSQTSKEISFLAWNDVSVKSGNNPQSCDLDVRVNDEEPVNIFGSGHIIATPFGSRAENAGFFGQELGFRERLLSSTSIGVGRQNAVFDIIPQNADVHITVNQLPKRHVGLFADGRYYGLITDCHITQDLDKQIEILFDPEKHENLKEQEMAVQSARPSDVSKALKLYQRYKSNPR